MNTNSKVEKKFRNTCILKSVAISMIVAGFLLLMGTVGGLEVGSLNMVNSILFGFLSITIILAGIVTNGLSNMIFEHNREVLRK